VVNVHFGFREFFASTAVVMVAAQPAWAEPAQITSVRLQATNGGVEITLQTQGGDRPQIFTTRSGNRLVADLIDTQLNLPQGDTFRKSNPTSGIASVVLTPLDANSVRMVVTGNNQAPSAQILQNNQQGIILGLNPNPAVATTPPGSERQTPQSTQMPSQQQQQQPSRIQMPPGMSAQQQPSQQQPPRNRQSQRQPSTSQSQDVLVPNPEITIDGQPAPSGRQGRPTPPFQPRAVAPPVGDMAVSNVSPGSDTIELGTQEVVPRLVLREAPVREVLSLLARAADLNLIFSGAQGQGNGNQGNGGAAQNTISLDVQNVRVQSVFNYVLRLSNLQANRIDNTIFVGSQLPSSAKNVIVRTFRLNQVGAAQAAAFLSAQGAESQRIIETTQTQVETRQVGTGEQQSTITNRTETTQVDIQPLSAARGEQQAQGPLLLRGLSIVTDERLNAITLIGEPRQIKLASSFLTQLDARRRQVAVNVKIIDISLNNTENINTSFSFGINDSFFVSDSGTAIVNFGATRPASGTEAQGTISPPVIQNPVTQQADEPFFNPNNQIQIPDLAPDQLIQLPDGEIIRRDGGPARTFEPVAPVTEDPFQGGFTDIELPEDTEITFDEDGNAEFNLGDVGEVTAALPDLFQFPTKFLARLRAEVVSGNAKILTDPTLVVQEGQQASVQLTEDIVKEVQVNFVDTEAGQRTERDPTFEEVGLTLGVEVDQIDDNGFVTLSVSPTVSAPGERVDLGDDTGFARTVQTRSVSSGQIRIRDGQTLILSGIIQESDRVDVTKWPILGDLPIIGSLFRSTNRENQRSEVIVLVTPRILNDSEQSTYGYGYTPGQEARQMLQQRGFQVPGQR
jgi:type IV pilus assembly protein PilQ